MVNCLIKLYFYQAKLANCAFCFFKLVIILPAQSIDTKKNVLRIYQYGYELEVPTVLEVILSLSEFGIILELQKITVLLYCSLNTKKKKRYFSRFVCLFERQSDAERDSEVSIH